MLVPFEFALFLHPIHIIQCRKSLNTVQIMVDKPFWPVIVDGINGLLN